MAARKYVCRQGDMIDLIAYEAFGYWSGAVNAILTLPENANLRDAGQKLEAGDVVWLPDGLEQESVKPQVRLWDET